MNVHNTLIENGYTLENGSILELESKKRYVVCKYDAETLKELNETSNRTQNLNFAGMMGIRSELIPACVCQFYPADLPRTWFIAFFRIGARQIDSLSNPVEGRNVATVLDQFQRRGLGESLTGGLWYSKLPDGYFVKNPHANDQPGLPSLTEFLDDEQEGWKPNRPRTLTAELDEYVNQVITPQLVDSIFSPNLFKFGPRESLVGDPLFGRLNSRNKATPPPPLAPGAPQRPAKPNKIGRLISLEEE